MAKIDKEYHKLLQYILDNGRLQDDPNREGVKRLNIPRYTFEYDLREGFPAITTKKLYWKGVVGELLFFLRGDTNIKYLVDNNINIWNKDAYNLYKKTYIDYSEGLTPLSQKEFISFIGDKEATLGGYRYGDLGRVYGAQWRDWKDYPIYYDAACNKQMNLIGYTKVDQIENLIKNLKEKPLATDHIVTAWNPAEIDDMALPPCHWSFEILVEPLSLGERKKLYNNKGNFMSTGSWGMSEEDIIKEYHKEYDRDNIPKYKFTLKWHQRSVDTFLGLPFNIASYALLAQIIGKMTNMIPKGIIGDLSNVHIYDNAIDAVKEQLTRDANKYDECELETHPEFEIATNAFNEGILNLDEYFSELRINMFKLKDYKSYPSIKAEMLSRNK